MSSAPVISVSEARKRIADLCDRVADSGERLVIARRGKSRVALVSADDLEVLEAFEDAMDLAAARRALREAQEEGTKPFEQLVEELGIDLEPA